MRTLALVICLAAACDAGDKPAPAPASPQQPPVILAHELPRDSDLVVTIDLASLRRTKLWAVSARGLAALLGSSDDVLDHAASIVVGVPLASGRAVAIIRGPQLTKTITIERGLPITLQTLRDELASRAGVQLQRLTGTARVTDRLDLRLAVTLGSIVEATNAATLVQSQRQSPQLRQLFDRFDCIAQGATVTFDLGMTEAQLAALLPQLTALVP